jgi:hypothetical protein
MELEFLFRQSKKGEVTTEQFKMQLKRNDAVLRGVVKILERTTKN